MKKPPGLLGQLAFPMGDDIIFIKPINGRLVGWVVKIG